MQQRIIVIKIQAECEECKERAMRVAAQTSGVNSVAWEAEFSNNRMVVIGEGVDVAALARSVKREAIHSSLETVQQL